MRDPKAFEADATHSDENRLASASIVVRAIRPDDWERLQKFHSRLSPATIEARFHAMKRELSEGLAHTFTTQDGHDNVALVATAEPDGRIVAVARYCRINRTAAEVAFVVEDDFQGRGIGARLMRELGETALANGIDTFAAEVLPDNMRMMRLLRSAGDCKVVASGPELELSVRLRTELHS